MTDAKGQEAATKDLTQTSAVGPVLQELFAHLMDVIMQGTGNAIHERSVRFGVPPNPALGDVTFRCFGLASLWKRDAAHIAKDLAGTLQPTAFIERFTAAGPYVNIHLKRDVLTQKILTAVQDAGELYGTTDILDAELIVLEYISANTNKPLHLGHLRNGLLGWSIAELLRSQGAEVVKTDIVNDRGIHIVKSMLAYAKWGNGETPQATGEKPDRFVGRYYVRFDQALQQEQQAWLREQQIDLAGLSEPERADVESRFRAASALWQEAQDMLRQWEAGGEHVRQLWKQMNDWAYAGIEQTYALFGFDFDKHYYESGVYAQGKAIIENAMQDGLFERAPNGGVIVPLSKHSDLPDKAVLRADGTGLYMTQDLYLAHKRLDDFGFTRGLYVIGSEQQLYMRQLFATLTLLKFPAADRLTHVSYGYVSLPEGRMKSREGTVVDADELFAEVNELALREVEQRYPNLGEEERRARAKAISLAAIKYHFLAVSKDADMTFDARAALAFEGRTGPYLLYSYARACSIVRKAASVPPQRGTPSNKAAVHGGMEPSEWHILLSLMDFPRVVADAAARYEPARVANFLADAAQQFSTFYHAQPVLEAPEPVRTTRLAIVTAFQTVMRNGLVLLGVEPLEEM